MHTIQDVSLIPLEYRMPPARAYGMARGLTARRALSIVRVTTDDGVVGSGEVFGPPAVARAYLDLVREAFLGRDIWSFEHVAGDIYDRSYHLGVQNQLTACLGGIDVALHDAIGRTVGVSVSQLLGGRRLSRVPVYASTGFFSNDPDGQLEAQLARVAGGGFPGVKIKIGRSPASDVERAEIARKIMGEDILLMLDVNGNYTVDVALESMRRTAGLGVHWYEEPLPPRDTAGYRRLRARAPVSLATGEAAYTVADFKRLVDAEGVDVVQPSIPTCGGLGQARQVAALARQNNLRVSPHVWGGALGLAAAVHFAASLPASPHTDHVPYPCLVEYDRGDNALRDDLLREPMRFENGCLVVPDGPGLGVDLDMKAVERYRAE